MAARADTITFDQEPGDFYGSIEEGLFRVESGTAFYLGNATFCSPDCPDNGSKLLLVQDGWDPVSIRTIDGAPFTLRSLELGEQHTNSPGPNVVLVRGFPIVGPPVEVAAALDHINDGTGPLVDLQVVTLPSTFDGLSHAEVVVAPPPLFGNHRYSLDNVEAEPLGATVVPTLSPLGAAIWVAFVAISGFVGISRRRRALRATEE